MSLRSILTITAICLAGTLQAQDQKPKALALVKEAVAFAKKNGKEALLKETNQGQGRFHVKSGDDLYIFIYDMTGVCQAIGFQSQMVGVNRWGVKDPDGKLFLQEMISLAKTKGSGWVDYKYPNPKSGKIEAKTSYVEFLDGWMVGCGIYK
ncbi:MAG: cache domain-containing protein [Geothrix sp.]|jgi:cytochrome c|uniref:Cache domain-containing protein n=1 Tax=Candidatus Geothrix odensensis TaxID=2954440 RepID=A0A936F262_9BACT|nr:cache domain-containing protein [Candidatus Geothrix odensensis]MBK8788816.1 cache domain-containing protein [Holophagaceae bacterium]MBP7617618.1 cache domain-containing protein [Geothrix sp.]